MIDEPQWPVYHPADALEGMVPGWSRPVMIGLGVVGVLAVPCGLLAMISGEPWGFVVFGICVIIWLAAMLAMALLLVSA